MQVYIFVDWRVKFPTIEVANEADYQCCRLFLDDWRAISVLIADLTPIICSQLSDQEVNSGHRAERVSSLATFSAAVALPLGTFSAQRTVHLVVLALYLLYLFVDCRMANQQLLWC